MRVRLTLDIYGVDVTGDGARIYQHLYMLAPPPPMDARSVRKGSFDFGYAQGCTYLWTHQRGTHGRREKDQPPILDSVNIILWTHPHVETQLPDDASRRPCHPAHFAPSRFVCHPALYATLVWACICCALSVIQAQRNE